MNRAGHYVEAERLAERAVQRIASLATEKYPLCRENARADALLDLQAALVHATLAVAGPGVEQEVIDQTRRDKPSQAERQAARPPLDGRPKPHPPVSKVAPR